MNPKSFMIALIAGAALHLGAQAAPADEYVYTPAPGVHETKFFHGCFDHTDMERRPKIKVIMNGLNAEDVAIETGMVESGKPSTELITFRVKAMDASLRVQFRSKDGEHCQQGVQSIAFKNAVVHNYAELAKYR